MIPNSTKRNEEAAAGARLTSNADSESPSYAPPALYVIGRSHDLLQGSGRHKNDDTGSRGFEVDQH